MESFWSVLRELLEKFIVLYPPFPEQATSTFLSIKGVAYLIGIICAIVVYERTSHQTIPPLALELAILANPRGSGCSCSRLPMAFSNQFAN